MTSPLSRRLVELYEALIAVYEPFAAPGDDWAEGGEPLDTLVQARDRSLAEARVLLDELQPLWQRWEREPATDSERLSVGTARSRLASLGVEVSRSDARIERVLQRKVSQLRHEAQLADRRSRVNQAYTQARLPARPSL